MDNRRGRALVSGVLSIVVVLAAACSSPGRTDAPVAADVVVFEGARLISGDGTAPIETATFIVSGGRFLAVGATGDVEVPASATRLDLGGKTVMPAIVDTHTHLNTTREALVEDLQRRAYYGVGTVMSLGQDDGDVVFQVRDEMIPDAARYRTAGRGITMPEPGRSEAPYWVTTDEDARQAVQELARVNVDLVKIWVDDRNGQYPKLGPPLYGAIIDEAHKNGLRVTAHIFNLEDAKGLLRAGIDAFAHGVRDRDIDDEFVALVHAHPDVVLVPNLPNRGVSADLGWLAGSMPAEELQRLRASAAGQPQAAAQFALQARNLSRLNDEGMPIALGTDGNTPWGAHVEMEDMVAAGMTPAQVLVAATRNSARLLGLEDEVGTIEVGRSADFLVLDGNPLDDITNTRRIGAVYLRGEAVDREGLSRRWMGGASQ